MSVTGWPSMRYGAPHLGDEFGPCRDERGGGFTCHATATDGGFAAGDALAGQVAFGFAAAGTLLSHDGAHCRSPTIKGTISRLKSVLWPVGWSCEALPEERENGVGDLVGMIW